MRHSHVNRYNVRTDISCHSTHACCTLCKVFRHNRRNFLPCLSYSLAYNTVIGTHDKYTSLFYVYVLYMI